MCDPVKNETHTAREQARTDDQTIRHARGRGAREQTDSNCASIEAAYNNAPPQKHSWRHTANSRATTCIARSEERGMIWIWTDKSTLDPRET